MAPGPCAVGLPAWGLVRQERGQERGWERAQERERAQPSPWVVAFFFGCGRLHNCFNCLDFHGLNWLDRRFLNLEWCRNHGHFIKQIIN